MSTSRPFAYNTGTTINGTRQYGSLSVGYPTTGFTNNPQYWNGPDEELGYIIAAPVPNNSQPTPISGVTASVQFYRSSDLTEASYVALVNNVFNQSFIIGEDAGKWVFDQGYYTTYPIVPESEFVTFVSTTSPASSHSFGPISIIKPGLIVLTISVDGPDNTNISNVLVNGNSAIQGRYQFQDGGGTDVVSAIYYYRVNDTSTINIQSSYTTNARVGIGIYRIDYNINDTPINSFADGAPAGDDRCAFYVDTPQYPSLLIATCVNITNASFTWSEMTEDYDNSVSTFFQATGARRSIVSDTSFTVLAISNIAAKALTAVMWQ